MGSQPKPLPPLDAWQVEQARLTVFPISPFPEVNSELALWQNVIGVEPESSTRRKFVRTVEGFPSGVAAQLTIDPQKIDWRFSLAIDLSNPPSGLRVIGPFTSAVARCESYFRTFLQSGCPPIKRLAFGAILIQPVENHEAGYRQLDDYLPAVTLSPESSEFLYRINRKVKAHSVSDLTLNRLSTWACIRQGRTTVAISAPDGGILTETGGEEFFCRLELDINTEAGRTTPLPESSLLMLWEELVGLGRGIAERGDVP